DAVVWLAQCIAEGLQHAHDRNLLHRDLKLANILITDDGQPLILDFNLAGASELAQRVGGTIPFMAPEQLDAFSGVPRLVDHRADIFSFGLMLYQLLAGRPAYPERSGKPAKILPQVLLDRMQKPLPIRSLNRAISPGLNAIVMKCLAPNTIDRYQSIKEVVEDLERHRHDEPLRFVPNTSLRERISKWSRRNTWATSPMAISAAVAALVLFGTAGAVAFSVQQKRHEVALQSQRAQEQYAQFLLSADQIETLLGSHPDQPLLIQRGANEALTLLRNHGILTDSGWDHAGDWSQLSTPQRETLQARAGQVGAMLARVQASAPRQGTDLERESAKEQVRAVVNRLKETPLFSERQPVLAAAQAQANGQFRLSLTSLQNYLRTHPSDASAWFLTGRAATMTGDYSEAVHAYSMHIALQPKSALGYFHRAIVQDLRRQPAVAILDVQQALRHDPNLMAGRILLAQLHMTLGQNSEASAVLNDILQGAEPPVRAWFMRAAVKDKMGDKAGSVADRLSGLSQPATDAPTLVARGFARMQAEPQAALKDFEHAER
ncbi:MAG: protein kinase domain-containing protein, partial [Gemmataceae bacterium]